LTDYETIEKLKAENLKLKAEIQTFKHTTKDLEIHRAATWLTRNEQNIVMNLWGAESIIASVWDMYFNMPDGVKKTNIEPIVTRAMEIATELNMINTAIAEKYSKNLSEKNYTELIIDTIRMLDTLSGKIRRCETCSDALERKKVIKAELIKELQK